MGAKLEKIKGKLKKTEGQITGDKIREAQGTVEEKVGAAREAMNRGMTRAKTRVRAARAKASRKATAARRTP